MEWRQQSTFSCADAFGEAQRWIEEVTGKPFGCSDFRAALENGVLLCDLINQLKPGIIKKLNRLSTPIAGLDNIHVFLKACEKLGLNESQLFHSGDLQDLSTRATLRRNESNRRLKNVLITVYWLGRKAHLDEFYSGPQLNFKAFEGLLGLALSKALDEGTNVFVKDGSYRECCPPGTWPSYKREISVDSIDSAESRATHTNNEGCGSDAEAEQVFRMETTQQLAKGHLQPSLLQRESGKGCSTSFIRSKSLSDIPMVHAARKVSEGNNVVDERRHPDTEEKLKSHGPARDSEAKWQDDLTKWKNRRRSTKSDLRRKSLDREHVINKMIRGAVNDHEEEGNHVHLERDQLSPQRHSLAPRTHSISPPSKCSSAFFRSHSRAPLVRSYATEVPLGTASSHSRQKLSPTQASLVGTMPDSNGNILGEETQFSSLALNGTAVTTPTKNHPFSSQTQFKSQGIPVPFHPTTHMTQPDNVAAQMSLVKTMLPDERESACTMDLSDTLGDLPDQRHKFEKESDGFPWENTDEKSQSQPASDTKKYLGRAASWSSSASLPRGFRRSEGSCRLSSVITARPFGTSLSRMSTLPGLSDVNSTTESQGPISTSEREGHVPLPASSLLKRQTATARLRTRHQDPMQPTNHVEKTALAKEARNSLPDKTFQTNGIQHQSQTYLNTKAQHRSLQCNVSMDIPKVDRRYLSVSLALKPNSQDFGFQPHWDTTGVRIKYIQPGGPAELCQLCVDDEILTVDGDAAAHTSSSLWEEKMASALQSGTLTMVICRYINKGGSESAISDLQVPSISLSSSSWSWDREDDRRRQVKWQEEQERLLQAQYKRDQQRLDTEWQKALCSAVVERENNMEMISGGQAPVRGVHVNGLANTEEHRPQELSTHNSLKKHQNEKIIEDRAESSSDFAPLSPAHRTKSLSTPTLGCPQKQQKGDPKNRKEEPVSKAEQERQQILEEMKKRTQLLTDNSWIRQRSSCFYKEPIYIGTPLKRYESLDILETSHSTSTAGYPRPHSASASYCGPIMNSSARCTAGTMTSQRNTPTDLHPGSVWDANSILEKQRMVSRFVSDTRSRTVSSAISSSSPPVLHPCDQDNVLTLAKLGVE